MAELVNLRTARKRAKRRAEDAQAETRRVAHGRPRRARELADAQRQKAGRDLDGHRIDTGDGR